MAEEVVSTKVWKKGQRGTGNRKEHSTIEQGPAAHPTANKKLEFNPRESKNTPPDKAGKRDSEKWELTRRSKKVHSKKSSGRMNGHRRKMEI